MTYLSRLILDPSSPLVRRDLGDCQRMHQRVMSAFAQANGDARAEFNVLYRLDWERQTRKLKLLVQTTVEPTWDDMPPEYLLHSVIEENRAWKFIGDKYEALRAGISLGFRLRANPTRKIDTKTGSDGKRRNGRRVEIRDEAEQLAWLARKGAQHGFGLNAVQIVGEDKSIGFKDARLTFAGVVFEGELMITDVDVFREALRQGIGTGKAYGFGLLSVAGRAAL